MNRANVVAVGAVSGCGIAVLAAIVTFSGDALQDLSIAVGFGLVTVLAIFAVARVLND